MFEPYVVDLKELARLASNPRLQNDKVVIQLMMKSGDPQNPAVFKAEATSIFHKDGVFKIEGFID